MTTKEKIIEEALRLFSRRGFHAVSVKEIASAVGIKDSSLYNHFKNKQAIFDTIVEVCFEKARDYFTEKCLPFEPSDDLSMYKKLDFEALEEKVLATFGYFFDDEHIVMFRRLLILSQFENDRAKTIYRELFRDYFITFQSRLFAYLIKVGEFDQEDPEVMARDFFGTVFMFLHTCDTFEEARPELISHLKHFVKQHTQTKYERIKQ